MKILVVDDDRAMREIMQRTIEKWGYEVVSACDGCEAIEAFNDDKPPRLVLLDLMMPKMGGIEACSRISTMRGGLVYIIVLTAINSRESLVEAMQSGAHDFLSKPVEMSELKARIAVGCRLVAADDLARKNQNFLEASVTAAGLGLWELNLQNGEFLFAPSVYRVLMLDNSRDWNITTWLEQIHPEDAPAARKTFDDYLDGDSDKYDDEYRIRDGMGKWEWVHISGRTVLTNPDGSACKICGALRNVTSRKLLEERNLEAHRMAAIVSLAGGVAHNFNNLAAGISGHLSLLENDKSMSEKSLARIERLHTTINKMSKITEALLQFSGKKSLQSWQESSVHQIVSDILILLREDYEKDGIKIISDLGEDIRLQCDQSAFAQAIYAVLENARHAVFSCIDKTIRISSFSDGGKLHLVIEDSGVGINKQDLDSVFLPFFSRKGEHAIPGSQQAHLRGSGLGLAMAKTILLRHGGYISAAHSNLGGASFSLILPLNGEPL